MLLGRRQIIYSSCQADEFFSRCGSRTDLLVGEIKKPHTCPMFKNEKAVAK